MVKIMAFHKWTEAVLPEKKIKRKHSVGNNLFFDLNEC